MRVTFFYDVGISQEIERDEKKIIFNCVFVLLNGLWEYQFEKCELMVRSRFRRLQSDGM